ncbi:hypothetical protein [Acaryochloris sp. IP29b_bin.137]|uniref:hypothetical protein n=1 Tax=Acaryochloris sp. IP29b_bin.137 TaxID=2969217 RepID=UPI00262B2B69|nr:hypothetical protein [Acaryochloris sp. IP29b_bin.137]
MQKKNNSSIYISLLKWSFSLYFISVGLWRLKRFFYITDLSSISTECSQAVFQSQKKINQLPNVQLNKAYWEKVDFLNDPPSGRPQKYQYILEDTSGLINVFNSSQFLTSISQNIMDSCSQVSMVGFSNTRFSAVHNYGLFPKDSVKKMCPFNPSSFVIVQLTYPFGDRNWRQNGAC